MSASFTNFIRLPAIDPERSKTKINSPLLNIEVKQIVTFLILNRIFYVKLAC